MLTQLETTINEYAVKKAPALPKNIKDILVKITPYFTILGIILAVPAIFALIGISAIASPLLVLGGGFGLMAIVSVVGMIATIILDVMAVQGLFKRQKSAWDKLFYASLISVVISLLGGHFISLIIGTAISWYILFQIRSYYR